ncbi:MAG: hypothetical protein ACRDOK_10840 [Streptosporangiaceae bacterium]
MLTPSTPLPVPPDAAPLEIVVTAAGQAWVGQQTVSVPAGTDPRAAAAAVASAFARQQGRDVHAVLVDTGRGERRRMLFTADGTIMQAAEAMTDGAGVALDPAQAAPVSPPDPPEPVDPAAVPAWPHFDLALTGNGHVLVNETLVAVPSGVADPRAFAVALAAAELARLGLARPVRATARDPDGTVWPILIHPGGAATEAGPPETPGATGKRSRRG